MSVLGGFRSFILLQSLDLHRRRSPHPFALRPVFIDGLPGADAEQVRERYRARGFSLEVASAEGKGSSPPARRRQRALASACARLGLNKVACAESLDDFLHVLLGNLFQQGRL